MNIMEYVYSKLYKSYIFQNLKKRNKFVHNMLSELPIKRVKILSEGGKLCVVDVDWDHRYLITNEESVK